MDVKAAVKRAKEYVADLLADEGIINLGLEEVVFDEGDGTWNVTVGFSRPWELARNPMTAITGHPGAGRAYRVVRIRDGDGEVVAFKQWDKAA